MKVSELIDYLNDCGNKQADVMIGNHWDDVIDHVQEVLEMDEETVVLKA